MDLDHGCLWLDSLWELCGLGGCGRHGGSWSLVVLSYVSQVSGGRVAHPCQPCPGDELFTDVGTDGPIGRLHNAAHTAHGVRPSQHGVDATQLPT
jgi:hypothetical protein